MYRDYFGFKEAPFSIAPDPRYLYMSEQHREALAHLLYGVNSEGGFVLLTGEVGTGKTTVCRCLLEQIPKNVDVAFIFNPKLTVEELLSTICDELRITYPTEHKSIKLLVDCINARLLDAHASGRSTLLIIDEAQNLSRGVLEQIRLLTNLETNRRKLLQIILLGQPELLLTLAEPKLRQLSQRIIARYHLGPLSRSEVGAYVNHRLIIAGAGGSLFPKAALARLHKLSGGVPRVINVLCDRALLGAYAEGKQIVDLKILKRSAREVFGQPFRMKERFLRFPQWAIAVALLLTIASVLIATQYRWTRGSHMDPPSTAESQPISTQHRKAIPKMEKPLKGAGSGTPEGGRHGSSPRDHVKQSQSGRD